MRKILIIGGFGFIGSHLFKSYEDDGAKVYRTSRYYDVNENEFSFQSDYSLSSFREILSKQPFDLVYYLSGNPYPGISHDNAMFDIQETITPLINLLTAAANSKFNGTLWFGSSVAVYGKTSKKFQSEKDRCHPLSNYALAKFTGEQYLKLFATNHSLSCGSLRIFSTFGEGLRRQLVFDLYTKALTDSSVLELIGTGREARDLCYVGDQVQRIKLIADRIRPKGDIYNIGNGSSISTYEVAKEVLKLMGVSKQIKQLNSRRPFDGYQWRACTRKFSSVAQNPITDFSTALQRTLDSYG